MISCCIYITRTLINQRNGHEMAKFCTLNRFRHRQVWTRTDVRYRRDHNLRPIYRWPNSLLFYAQNAAGYKRAYTCWKVKISFYCLPLEQLAVLYRWRNLLCTNRMRNYLLIGRINMRLLLSIIFSTFIYIQKSYECIKSEKFIVTR